LWRAVDAWRTEHRLLLEPWELEMVTEICRAVDRCASLRVRIAEAEAEGDNTQWLRFVQEERQQRAILGRVVAASTESSFATINPATGRELGYVAHCFEPLGVIAALGDFFGVDQS
jgi:hypothetical protein